ncbi:hydrolethalus syndrome protein 1 [Arapaima gigas]
MAQLGNWSFSEAEVEEQLRALGYCRVPAHRLRLFKRDLDQLILHERSSSSQWTNSSSCSQLLTAPRDEGTGSGGNSLSSPSPETQGGASRHLVLKQKFTRKRAGRSRTSRELVLGTESLSGLEEQLEGLRVSESRQSDDSSSSDTALSSGRFYSDDSYRSHTRNSIPARPKSFIYPQFEHPHNRNLKKTDPVAKYFKYKQHWETFKAPGENKWTELRKEIRVLTCFYTFTLQNLRRRCQSVTKTTVVPTEKKRLALRWKVRHDLANGVMPAKITYPF